MVVGLAVAAVLMARPPFVSGPSRGVARTVGLALLTCPLLILPSVVAVSGLPPSHMRSVAIVPLVFFLPALGVVALARAVAHVLRRDMGRQLVAAMLLAVVFGLGVNTFADYRVWGARADVFYDADGDLQAAARWLERHAAPTDLIYIASVYYEHPTVLAHALRHEQIRWMTPDQMITQPPGRAGLYIFPRSVNSPWVESMPAYEISPATLPNGPDGRPAFRAFRRPPESAITDPPAPISFGGLISPMHLDDEFPGKAGAKNTFVTAWQVVRTPTQNDLTPIVAANDQHGAEIARAYPYFEHTNRWLPGEVIQQAVRIDIPVGTPPGAYSVHTAWVEKSREDSYLPLLNAKGEFAGVWHKTFTAYVQRGNAPSAQQMQEFTAQGMQVAPGLWLRPVSILPAQAEQGSRVTFSVDWLALAPLPALGFVRARLGDTILWQGDPAGNTYPFSRWEAGEQVTDRYHLSIPHDFAPGAHEFHIELSSGGAILAAFSQRIHITAVERAFTPPMLQFRTAIDFGDSIQLVGYEVAPNTENAGTITVRLAWQALDTPPPNAAAYTVFVHVVNPDTSLYDQVDRPPSRATNRWVEGEFIVDDYALKVPDGPYYVRIGLYQQQDGYRLPIRDRQALPGGSPGPQDFLIIFEAPKQDAP
jgi:hypothetical protein